MLCKILIMQDPIRQNMCVRKETVSNGSHPCKQRLCRSCRSLMDHGNPCTKPTFLLAAGIFTAFGIMYTPQILSIYVDCEMGIYPICQMLDE